MKENEIGDEKSSQLKIKSRRDSSRRVDKTFDLL
jgi:hypothetical protein